MKLDSNLNLCGLAFKEFGLGLQLNLGIYAFLFYLLGVDQITS